MSTYFLMFLVVLAGACGGSKPVAETDPIKPIDTPAKINVSNFPLRAGDVVEFVLGSRHSDDTNSFEHTVKAHYTIVDVDRSAGDGQLKLKIETAQTLQADEVTIDAVSQLYVAKLLMPQAKELDKQVYTERTVKIGTILPEADALDAFPFAWFGALDSDDDMTRVALAADSFRNQILSIDPEASVYTQASTLKFEAYFKDTRFAHPYLHELSFVISPFGFVTRISERLIEWQEGMRRDSASFVHARYAAVFPIFTRLIRDEVTYDCSGKLGRCKSLDGKNMCLMARPDAIPQPCS